MPRIEPCNRVDRFNARGGYLDGERPYLIACRGYYTRATLAAYGVDFIDKDDARCRFLRLFEHVTNTGCTHTDEHFYEVRTGDSKERNFRFACNRFRQQRFTGTRRTDHQDAFRDLTAEFLEAARLAQILYQFSNFLLLLRRSPQRQQGRLI